MDNSKQRKSGFGKNILAVERYLFNPQRKHLAQKSDDLAACTNRAEEQYFLHFSLAERMIIRRHMQTALERRKADFRYLQSIYTDHDLWKAIVFVNFNIVQEALFIFMQEFYGCEDAIFNKPRLLEIRRAHQLRLREAQRDWAD